MPVTEYSSEAKYNLIGELVNDNLFFLFKNWQCIRHIKVTGKALTLDTTNIYKNIYNPVCVFVFSNQIDLIAN